MVNWTFFVFKYCLIKYSWWVSFKFFLFFLFSPIRRLFHLPFLKVLIWGVLTGILGVFSVKRQHLSTCTFVSSLQWISCNGVDGDLHPDYCSHMCLFSSLFYIHVPKHDQQPMDSAQWPNLLISKGGTWLCVCVKLHVSLSSWSHSFTICSLTVSCALLNVNLCHLIFLTRKREALCSKPNVSAWTVWEWMCLLPHMLGCCCVYLGVGVFFFLSSLKGKILGRWCACTPLSRAPAPAWRLM